MALVVDVGPEKLAESLEDRLSAAAVALLHVTVQRVQTLVASRGRNVNARMLQREKMYPNCQTTSQATTTNFSRFNYMDLN